MSSTRSKTRDHYRIAEKIGAGGTGEVNRAHDEQLGRDAAPNLLPAGTLADEATRKQFRKETLALAKRNLPNIEAAFESSSHAGLFYTLMVSRRCRPRRGGPSLDEQISSV